MDVFTRMARSLKQADEVRDLRAKLAHAEFLSEAAREAAANEIADLTTELEQTAIATKAMHNLAQATIGRLRAEKVQLRDELAKAKADLRRALDEIKHLDRQLVLTPAQREDAADDAAWKRNQDGVGER